MQTRHKHSQILFLNFVGNSETAKRARPLLRGKTKDTLSTREHWPPRNWGSKEDKDKWGLIQLLLTTLGRFADHLKAYIGLPKLKSMKNEEEFLKCLEMTNDELGELSHQQARLLAKFVPKQSMEKTIEQVRTRVEDAETTTPYRMMTRQPATKTGAQC